MNIKKCKKNNKLSDTEIIKALECCMDEMGCKKGCPCFDPKSKSSHCTAVGDNGIEKLALDLINRQKANLDDKEDTIQYADKVIKSLQADMDRLQANVSELVKQTKVEAYKEFANWQEIKLANNPNISTVTLQSIIKTNDNLLKEVERIGDK